MQNKILLFMTVILMMTTCAEKGPQFKINIDLANTEGKIVYLQKDGEEKYDKLTEEIYLFNNATKSNKKNQTIINEFLERKKNEELANKIGLDQEKENELEHFKDNKRISIITDRDTSLKPRRTFIEFYEDQINKQEKHKNHLMENEKKHNNKISSNVLSKPVLNEETIKIANKIKRNDNIEIHQRLYDEYNVIKQQKPPKSGLGKTPSSLFCFSQVKHTQFSFFLKKNALIFF